MNNALRSTTVLLCHFSVLRTSDACGLVTGLKSRKGARNGAVRSSGSTRE